MLNEEQILPIEFKFIPRVQFEYHRKGPDGNDRLIGQYHPGMSYNCTKNPIHDQLREMCKEWFAKDMIKIIPLEDGQQFKMVKPEQLAEELNK